MYNSDLKNLHNLIAKKIAELEILFRDFQFRQ